MGDLLSGLESMGLGNLSNMNVFSDEEEKQRAAHVAAQQQKQELTEEDYLFDKTHMCPCCDREFKCKAVKTGKPRMVSMDTDLRAKYIGIDPVKYDVIVCPYCGYAAVNRFFDQLMNSQAKLIKENISKSFTGLDDSSETYGYDYAITRYKLALVNTIVKRGKLSERAYVCLKTAWVLRGKRETLSPDLPDFADQLKKLETEEKEFIAKACEGFSEAFQKEEFPICGMDEHTATYLVADLCRQCGKYDEANRWVSKVITSRNANERIKNKAREIKDMIAEIQGTSGDEA